MTHPNLHTDLSKLRKFYDQITALNCKKMLAANDLKECSDALEYRYIEAGGD
jgi:hypothetical protein